MAPNAATTHLIAAARAGDRDALDALLPRVYDELRQIAHARLRRQRAGDTLNTTAVVHEAYLKLTAGETPPFRDRAHFFALAARAMRFVLIGYARERTALKRGGPERDLPLDASPSRLGALAIGSDGEADAHDLIALDTALDRLAEHSERLAETVELRFFGGMTHDEIAEATGRSVPTVKRDWRRARAYLYQLMNDPQDDPNALATDPPPPNSARGE
ncbi:MAG: ECF-type sigma factor [Rubricoccaceae bacterium]